MTVVSVASVGGGGQAQRRVGCQHAVVVMAVPVRRRDRGGEVVDELQQGEGQRGASVARGLGKTIVDLLLVDLPDPLEGERRTRTVA